MRTSLTLRICVCLTALCLFAQAPVAPAKDPQTSEAKGVPPRTAPSDYQAQAQAGAFTIAAEFTGHGVPTPDGVYNTEDYIIVEVALFGAPEARLKLATEDFSLRVNGKKNPSPSLPFELVRRSLKDPNWEPPVTAEAKSKTSIGGGGKGDQGNLPPTPPKMPMDLQHTMSQRVQRAALLQGDRALPQAGLLFFQYGGKLQNIHSLELIYSGAAGQATLKLQ